MIYVCIYFAIGFIIAFSFAIYDARLVGQYTIGNLIEGCWIAIGWPIALFILGFEWWDKKRIKIRDVVLWRKGPPQ